MGPIKLVAIIGLIVIAATVGARGEDDAQGAAPDKDTDTVNLSHDLVRLGIASRNLPPDSPASDARPLLQAALLYVQSHPVRRLTVDRGTYYFLTPQNPQAYLSIRALSDLTMDLADSTVYFAGAYLQGFAIVDCQRVTLTRFHADFLDPPYTHVRLTAVDTLARSLDYTRLLHWPDPVTFNAITVPNEAIRPPVLWAMVFRNGAIVPGTSRMHVAQPIADGVLALTQDNTPWTQSATLATLRPGDTVVVAVRGGLPTVSVVSGDSIAISDATIHGSSGIAVLFQGSSHSTAERVQVVPRPDSGLIAANADGIHFTSSGPGNSIRHSFVTRTMDDALAIDSIDIATVVSQIGARQLNVTRTAFLRFPNGTAVNFIDPLTGAELSGATIVFQDPPDQATRPFGGPVSLTFDRDLPTLAPGFGMAQAAAAARGAGSSIADNVVRDIPFGRGVWIGGAEGVTIARNDIGHTSNGGIAVAQNTSPAASPVPPAHAIRIEDNVLRGSLAPAASGSGTAIAVGAILVETTTTKATFSPQPVNTDISIERNRIVDSGRSGIWVGDLDGGTIRGNVIRGWDEHPELPLFGVNAQTRAQLLQDFTQALVIHNSQHVRADDNVTIADPDHADGPER
jgi:hypothetical protein